MMISTSTLREPVQQALPKPAQEAEPTHRAAPAAVSPPEEKPLIAAERAQAALAEINQTLQLASIGVRFEFDKEADVMIAKVVDAQSGEVIRQMPTEEVLHISRSLGKLQGLLVHDAV